MYAVMDVYARNLRPGQDLDVAGRLIALSLGPLGWVAVNVDAGDNDLMPFGCDYQVRAAPEDLRLRAVAVGIRAEHALWRRFDDDIRIQVAIPTFKNPRRMRELMAALDRGAAEARIDSLGGRVFRSLFPTRVTDVRLSRILREHLPRIYPEQRPAITGRNDHLQPGEINAYC